MLESREEAKEKTLAPVGVVRDSVNQALALCPQPFMFSIAKSIDVYQCKDQFRAEISRWFTLAWSIPFVVNHPGKQTAVKL